MLDRRPPLAPAGAAVFTDSSGRRSAVVTRVLAAIALLAIGYLGALGMSLGRGPGAPAGPAHRPEGVVTQIPAPGVTVPLTVSDGPIAHDSGQ